MFFFNGIHRFGENILIVWLWVFSDFHCDFFFDPPVNPFAFLHQSKYFFYSCPGTSTSLFKSLKIPRSDNTAKDLIKNDKAQSYNFFGGLILSPQQITRNTKTGRINKMSSESPSEGLKSWCSGCDYRFHVLVRGDHITSVL